MARVSPERKTARRIIIGIGNEYRGDDAVGIAVVRKLKALHLHACTVIEAAGDGAGLIDLWDPNDSVILVDATVSGSSPGSVTRIDLLTTPVAPESFRFSSHAVGLASAIELARTLGRLPARAILYGIEGIKFDHGTGMSPDVFRSVEALVGEISKEISLN